MGVDISHIIRHNFYEVEDKDASKLFVQKTIERLKNNLHIQNSIESFRYHYDEESNETTFYLPLYDVEFTLHNGFWQIESFYHYCQVVMHEGSFFWLRRLTFDIAKALGQNEAWYANEYYTWNGGGCEDSEATFEQWLEWSVKEYGKDIPEFDQSSIIDQGDVHIPEYEPIYHDSFKECNELFSSIQLGLQGLDLIGLTRFELCKLRCERNNSVVLIKEDELVPGCSSDQNKIVKNNGKRNNFIKMLFGQDASDEKKKETIETIARIMHDFLVFSKRTETSISELFDNVVEGCMFPAVDSFGYSDEIFEALKKEINKRKVLRMHCTQDFMCVGLPWNIIYRFTREKDYQHLHFPRNSKSLALNALLKCSNGEYIDVEYLGFYKERRAYKAMVSPDYRLDGFTAVLVDQEGKTLVAEGEDFWDIIQNIE